jgi:hypothetical protein
VTTYLVYNYTDKPLSVSFSDDVKVEARTKCLTVQQWK